MPDHDASPSKTKHTPVPLVKVLRSRHRRQWSFFWLALLGVIICCYADHLGFFLYPGDMIRQYDGRFFDVVKVVDGDTLDIRTGDNGESVRLRLWGVDTPEIANQNKGTSDEPFSRLAMAWTLENCQGKKVKLALQPQRIWGKYGRLLCYVYLEDGRMLNEQLLLHGLAKTDSRFVHEQMHRFEVIQQQAQFDRIGLWGKSKPSKKE